MNRKAIFFSIISVLIVLLFGSMTSMISDFKLGEGEIEVTRTRIKVLNSLVKDMDNNYFEKLLYVSGKNSLIGLSRYYSDAQGGEERVKKPLAGALSDVMDDGILVEPVYGGTLKRNLTQPNAAGISYIDEEFTLNALVRKLKVKYSDLGMNISDLTLTISASNITQIDPWHLQIEADIVYDLKDITGIAIWRGIATKAVNISVYGIYAYDSPLDSGKDHKGRITSRWIVDNGGRVTESPVLVKLSKQNPSELDEVPGYGLCSPDYIYGSSNCSNDVVA